MKRYKVYVYNTVDKFWDCYEVNAIDFNTGVIADGEKTIDEAAKDLLDLVIRVASGEQTKAEKHGFREISIFKDGVVL